MRKAIKILGYFASIVAVAAGLFVAERHGYVPAPIGIMVDFFFPPKDLFTTLSSEKILAGKKTYELSVDHKHPGTYGVKIYVPHKPGAEYLDPRDRRFRDGVSVDLRILKWGITLCRRTDRVGTEYVSRSEQGALFCRYFVPMNMGPLGRVTCRVTLYGNVNAFCRSMPDLFVGVVNCTEK